MKKSKKSSKSKKPVVIFIYGPIAAGKLTVAKILSKKLGYKLIHNHHLNDFIEEVFERGSYANHAMKDFLRYYLLENSVKAKMNIITTHCYSHDWISKTGLSDPKYVETLEKKLTELGAIFYPLRLKASSEELLRRVSMSSRQEFRKLTNKKIMRKLALKHDWQTSPRLKNNLVIDNTKLSPQKVSDMVIKHFKIQSQ